MKILTIHADFIEFEAKKKALKDASPAEEGKKRVEECLVVFTAVEKRDEEDLHKIIDKELPDAFHCINPGLPRCFCLLRECTGLNRWFQRK